MLRIAIFIIIIIDSLSQGAVSKALVSWSLHYPSCIKIRVESRLSLYSIERVLRSNSIIEFAKVTASASQRHYLISEALEE